VETVAACIKYRITNIKQKGMMPMGNNHLFFDFAKTAASFAAYTITLALTNDASAATALNQYYIRIIE